MQSLFFLSLFAVFGLIGLAYRQTHLRRKARERMTRGFTQTAVPLETDLMAGDYALVGQARLFYHLREFLATTQGKLLMFCIGAVLTSLSAALLGQPGKSVITAGMAGGVILLIVGIIALHLRKKEQDNQIRNEMPNLLETVAAIMEGGLAFEAALAHVVRESDLRHPLYFDLNIVNEAMRRGRRRSEALRLWAARSNNQVVGEVVSGLVQAEQTGASLGAVLKHHAQAILRENEALIQRRAERLPAKMVFPMAFLILPAIFVVAAGPSILRIFQIITEITSQTP